METICELLANKIKCQNVAAEAIAPKNLIAHMLIYSLIIKTLKIIKKKIFDTQTRCNCWTKLFYKIILRGKNVHRVF